MSSVVVARSCSLPQSLHLTLLSSLPVPTKAKLSSLLDYPHPFGQDWCQLALQLSFMEEVPRIHQANDCSPAVESKAGELTEHCSDCYRCPEGYWDG